MNVIFQVTTRKVITVKSTCSALPRINTFVYVFIYIKYKSVHPKNGFFPNTLWCADVPLPSYYWTDNNHITHVSLGVVLGSSCAQARLSPRYSTEWLCRLGKNRIGRSGFTSIDPTSGFTSRFSACWWWKRLLLLLNCPTPGNDFNADTSVWSGPLLLYTAVCWMLLSENTMCTRWYDCVCVCVV